MLTKKLLEKEWIKYAKFNSLVCSTVVIYGASRKALNVFNGNNGLISTMGKICISADLAILGGVAVANGVGKYMNDAVDRLQKFLDKEDD